ncbi:MAG: hypothetical protein ACLQNE_06330 [Thermoguttaceae bacterium]
MLDQASDVLMALFMGGRLAGLATGLRTTVGLGIAVLMGDGFVDGHAGPRSILPLPFPLVERLPLLAFPLDGVPAWPLVPFPLPPAWLYCRASSSLTAVAQAA